MTGLQNLLPTEKLKSLGNEVYQFENKSADEKLLEDTKKKSWLEKKNHPLGPIPQHVDLQLFNFLDGDAFPAMAPDSPGNSAVYYYDYLLGLFENIRSRNLGFTSDHKAQIDKICGQLKQCKIFSESIEKLKTHTLNLQQYSEKVSKDVAEKNINDVWIPIYSGNTHLVLHVDRVNNSIRIFSPRAGLEAYYEGAATTSEKRKGERPVEEIYFQQCLEIAECDPERLNSKEFYEFVFGMSSRGRCDPGYAYDGLKTFLKGKAKASSDNRQFPEMYRKPARSESDIIRAPLTMVYYSLADADAPLTPKDVDCYKKLKFLWQTQALCSAALNVEQFDVKMLALVESITRNIARSAEKLQNRNLLDETELEQWEATAHDILSRVKTRRKAAMEGMDKSLSKAEKKLPEVVVDTKQINPAAITIEHVVPGSTSKQNDSSAVSSQRIDSDLVEQIRVLKRPKKGSKDLGEWKSYINQLINMPASYERRKLLLDAWQECIASMDVPAGIEADDAEELSEDQINAKEKEINAKLEEYRSFIFLLKLSFEAFNDGGNDLVQLVGANLCLLAIIDNLAQQSSQSNLFGRSFSADLHIQIVNKDFLIVDHPIFDKQISKAMHYFSQNKPITAGHSTNPQVHLSNKSLTGGPSTGIAHFFSEFMADEDLMENFPDVEPAEFVATLMTKPMYLPESLRHYYESYCYSLQLILGDHEFTHPVFTKKEGELEFEGDVRLAGFRYANNPQGMLDKYSININLGNFKKFTAYTSVNGLNYEEYSDVIGKSLEQTFLTNEQSIRLRMINIDSKDKANRALGVFKNNMALFEDPDSIPFMLTMLLSHGNLQRLVEQEPNYIKVLEGFFDKAIDHFREYKKLNGLTQVMLLGQLIKEYLDKGNYPHSLPDFRQKLLDIAQNDLKNAPAGDKAKIYSVNMALRNSMPYEECYFSLHGIEDAGYLAFHANMPLNELQVDFFELFNKSEKAKVLNNWLRSFVPEAGEHEWKTRRTDHAELICTSGDYTINVTRGTININASTSTSTHVPELILNSDCYKEIFTSKKVECSINALGEYVIKSSEDEITVSRQSNRLYFYKMINGKKYRYCTETEKAQIDLLLKGYRGYFIEIDNDLEAFNEDFVSINSIIARRGSYINFNYSPYQYWVDDDKRTVLIFHGKKNVGEIEIKKQPQTYNYTVENIKRLSDGTAYLPNNYLPKTFDALKNVTPAITAWCNPETNKIKEINLDKHGYKFTHKRVNNRDYLYCKQHPGYFLVDNPPISGFGNNARYITLANHNNEHIVLLDKSYYDQTKNNAFLEFKLESGELVADKLESQLALIHYHIKACQYAKADKLISKLFFMKRISDKDSFIPRLILEAIHKELQANPHPDALGIALKLALVELQNRGINPLKKQHKKAQDKLSDPRSQEDGQGLTFSAKSYQQLLKLYPAIALNSVECKLSIEERVHLANLFEMESGTTTRFNAETEYRLQRSRFLPLGDIVAQPESNITSLGAMGNVGGGGGEGSALSALDKALKTPYHSNPFDIMSYPLVQDQNFFEGNVHQLYKIAIARVEGTPEEIDRIKSEKERLKTLLELNKKVRDSGAYKVLSVAMRIPALCPSPEFLDNVTYKFQESRFKFIGSLIQMVVKAPLYASTIAYAVNVFFLKTALPLLKGLYNVAGQKVSKFFGKPWKVAQEEINPVKPDPKILNGIDHAFDNYLQSNVNHYIEIKTIDEKIDMDVLPTEHKDPKVSEDLKKENANLEQFRKNVLKPQRTFTFKDSKNGLNEMYESMKAQSETLFENLCVKQQAILWQANRIPDNASSKHLDKIGNGRSITWEDLQRLTLKGDLNQIKAKTYLNDEEAKQLMTATAALLSEGSRIYQLNFILTQLSAALKNEKIDERKCQLYIQTAVEAMEISYSMVPERKVIDNLWFEYTNQYMYRLEQLEKIREITSCQSPIVLAEMPTGFGKTKCLVTTLNNHYSKTGKLVFGCCPATLETTNVLDWHEQDLKTYGKNTIYVSFDRASNFSGKDLEELYNTLKQAQQEGRAVSVSPESVRSLELHLLTLLDELNDNKLQALGGEKRVEFMIRILQLMYAESWIMIDEAHVNLCPLDQIVYTRKDGGNLSRRDVVLIEKIFKFMTEEPLKSKINLESNGQVYLTDKEKEDVASTLADLFVTEFNISAEQLDSYKKFVLAKAPRPAWLAGHRFEREICLLKGEVSIIFPSSLGGKVDTNFGLSKKHFDTKEFAISYLSADTPKETETSPSQYDNPHETMTKTYMTYLYKGLQKEQFHKLIKVLRRNSQIQSANGKNIADTPAVKTFRDFAPEGTSPLLRLTNVEIDQLYEQLSRDRKVIFSYIEEVVVEQLKLYEKTVVSTASNFLSQVSNSLSVTATPQDRSAHNSNTVFLGIAANSDLRSETKVTHLLLTKCGDKVEKAIHILKDKRVKDENGNEVREPQLPADRLDGTIDIMKNDESNRIAAIIDVGAQFAGLNNLEIAKKICEKVCDDDESGVLFFDTDDGVFKIYEKSGAIVDLSESQLTPEQRKTLYDEARCTGSDLKQGIDAVALLMTDIDTDLEKVAQSSGRMRQLHKEQSVQIVVPEKVSEEVFADRKPNIKDLLVYWIEKKRRNREDLNYRSQIQQMDNALRRGVMNRILNIEVDNESNKVVLGEPSIEQAMRYSKNNYKVLYRDTDFDPVKMYANWLGGSLTLDSLKQHYDNKVLETKNSYLPESERQNVLKELEKIPTNWKDLALSEKTSSSLDLDMECEVQQEVQVNTKEEIQPQTNVKNPNRLPVGWRDTDLFNSNWDKPWKLYPLFKRGFKRIFFHLPGSFLDEFKIIAKKVSHLVISLGAFAIGSGAYFAAIGTLCGAIGGVIRVIPWALYPTWFRWMNVALEAIKDFGNAFLGAGLVYLTAGAITAAAGVATVALGFAFTPLIRACDYIIAKFKLDNYIASVRDTMRMHFDKELYECHRLIPKNLFATHNFYQESIVESGAPEPVAGSASPLRVAVTGVLSSGNILTPQKPFTKEQKLLVQVMIVENELKDGTKDLKVIMMEQNDSPFFREKLENDQYTDAETAEERKKKIAIYDLEHRCIVKQGKNRFDEAEIAGNQKLQNTLIMCRFMNGDYDFTPEEMTYLVKKINKVGKANVLSFVNKVILPNRPSIIKFYQDSMFYNWLITKDKNF